MNQDEKKVSYEKHEFLPSNDKKEKILLQRSEEICSVFEIEEIEIPNKRFAQWEHKQRF